MTIFQLILYVSIVGLLLTFISYFLLHKKDSFLISFLQHTVGVLFLFSGWVKAIDPMGTAFKMVDYFTEFESAFAHSPLSFLSGLFPWLAKYAIGFSVAMIVFEMLLGLALIIGWRRKLTAWLFTLLVLFFTFMTGYTFLTGYVPRDAHFFQFGSWSSTFDPTNMRVTDCGCFGDFIKLDPRVSFLKDLVLLIPGVLFILFAKRAHQLFGKKSRKLILGISLVGLILYCLSNYVWDLPQIDFRPFSEGTNIRKQRKIEEQAMANVQIIGWEMINTNTQESIKVYNPKYSEVVKKYPKEEGWTVKDQVQSEPAIKPSKISEFEFSDSEGNDRTKVFLDNPNYIFWIINYKLPHQEFTEELMVYDTIFRYDTLQINDQTQIVKHFVRIDSTVQKQTIYQWDEQFVSDHLKYVKPVIDAAEEDNVGTFALIKDAPPEMMLSYQKAVDIEDHMVFKADDILLKTIIRSNPGLLLVKDGKIIKKWHKYKIPSYKEIKQKYMSE